MTNETQQARRAAFEALFPPPYYISWNTDRAGYYSIHRDSTRKRHSECYDSKWQGYCAALDSLVISLPSIYGCKSVSNMRAACQDAIHAAGVKTR